MKTTSTNYNTYNQANSKPVWIAIFPDLPASSGKHCSASFLSMDVNYQRTIIGLNYHSISIDRLEPSTDLNNEYEIIFQDQDLAFTQAMTDDNIFGRSVTIKLGFAEIAETDFLTLPTLTVTDVELLPDMLSWRVRAQGALFNLNQKIFRGLAQNALNGDIASLASTITVDSTNGFVDPGSITFPSYIRPCILIDSELKSYTGLTGTSFTGCASVANTGDVDHFDNAVVKQAFAFYGNPLQLLVHILMTSDTGANGFYDLGIPGFGLGLTAVNLYAIERLGYKILSTTEYSFPDYDDGAFLIATDEATALDWLEENCLAPALCYLFVNSAGLLDVAAIDQFWDSENWTAVKALNSDEIFSASFEFEPVINWIETQYQREPQKNSFSKLLKIELDDSVSEYGRSEQPFIYRVFGNPFNDVLLNSATPRYFYWARRVFNGYGDVTGKIKFETNYKNLVLDVNDPIEITCDNLPELTNGSRGWTSKKAIITGISIDFSGLVTIEADTYELFTRLDQLSGSNWSVSEVLQANIDDTAVAYSSDNTITIEAADAYFDNTADSFDADLVVFFVEVAEQATGTVTDATIGLRVQVRDGSNLITANDSSRIHYNPQGSEVLSIPLYLWVSNSFDGIITAKLDWFYRSESAPDDQPVITLKKLWFVTFNRDMSIS